MADHQLQLSKTMTKSIFFSQKAISLLTLGLMSIGLANAEEPHRILVYGDSNTYGWVSSVDSGNGHVVRLNEEDRWPEHMRKLLSPGTIVTVDALGGRTVDLNEVGKSGLGKLSADAFNGLARLPETLAANAPIDLVVVMLGTNDLKYAYERTSYRIAIGLGAITDLIRSGSWQSSTNYPAPKVLIVSPPYLSSQTAYGKVFDGARDKSRQLSSVIEPIVRLGGAEFLDAGAIVGEAGQKDRVHLDAQQHKVLGTAIAEKVSEILNKE